MFKGFEDAIFAIFLIGCLLYGCTDRHLTWEYNGTKHELWIDKPAEAQQKD